MNAVRQKYALPEQFILFLGTIEPRKNIRAIIEAFSYARERQLVGREYELVIAGSKGWKTGPIMRHIEKTHGTSYIGYVDEADKRALMRESSLFVYPSIYEGFGLPVLEALSEGVPTVTSNRSSLPEVAGDGAYLCDPYDVADIARGMARLLNDSSVREWHSARGKENVTRFSWEKTAQQFVSLCDTIHASSYGI